MYLLQMTLNRNSHKAEFVIYENKDASGISLSGGNQWDSFTRLVNDYGHNDLCINTFRLEIIR